jgi:hypothetical protein
MPEAELAEWNQAYTAALDVMGDESKEADLSAIQHKLAEKMEAKGIKVRCAALECSPFACAREVCVCVCVCVCLCLCVGKPCRCACGRQAA